MDPPEERLYPVLDDLLEDWLATFHHPLTASASLAEMVAAGTCGQGFPRQESDSFQWLDVEIDPEARKLDEQAGDGKNLPLVLFPDGSRMREPTAELVAKKVGLKTRALMPSYDLGIIGAGPAAAVYGAGRAHHVMIEREAPEVRRDRVRASRTISDFLRAEWRRSRAPCRRPGAAIRRRNSDTTARNQDSAERSLSE